MSVLIFIAVIWWLIHVTGSVSGVLVCLALLVVVAAIHKANEDAKDKANAEAVMDARVKITVANLIKAQDEIDAYRARPQPKPPVGVKVTLWEPPAPIAPMKVTLGTVKL